MASQPSRELLEAFGVRSPLKPLSGGRGLCFEAGGIVLRPSDDDAESEWVGDFINRLSAAHQNPIYRLPIPIKSATASFVHHGWTASTFLSGHAASPVRWQEVRRVCRQFHADVKNLNLPKPDFLSTRRNRFHEADLVTWDEKVLSHVEKVNEEVLAMIEPALSRLQHLKKTTPDLPDQIIHGDLTGNVLFDGDDQSDTPPGIIDMTVYWRPTEYAEAIIVADGLIWHGQGSEFLRMFGIDDVRLQLVVRALYWRCLCFAIDPDLGFIRAFLPKADFIGAAEMVRVELERLKTDG